MPLPTFRCLLPLVGLAILIQLVAPAAARPAESFTVVLIPDTQNYSEKFPDTYLTQTRWIRNLAACTNVKFAIHLGDIVQYSDAEQEWRIADRAHRQLDGCVPYSVLPGNHDGAPGNTALYNKYFPPERFEAYCYYGGHKDDNNDNNYCFFHAAGMTFMVLSLEYNPRDETLAWADGVVNAHPECRVILATHTYMTPKGRNKTGNHVWNRFVRKHENIFMVLSGHVLGVAHQTSLNDAGGRVHEILCDYQGLPNGGDGWLQTLCFVPAADRIHVRAYSPLLDEYNDAPEHSYTLDYDMIVCRPIKAAGSQFARIGLRRGCRVGLRCARRGPMAGAMRCRRGP